MTDINRFADVNSPSHEKAELHQKERTPQSPKPAAKAGLKANGAMFSKKGEQEIIDIPIGAS